MRLPVNTETYGKVALIFGKRLFLNIYKNFALEHCYCWFTYYYIVIWQVMMSQLSGHGVKMVLPKIMKGMTDDVGDLFLLIVARELDCDFRHQLRLTDDLGMLSQAWRTKRASIQMLGAMAFCSPQQLASCLPQIIPYLVDAFTDTHQKVLKGTDDKSKRALIPNSSHANT